MTRIDIISGFLGAGKTTWIKRWISTETYLSLYPQTAILENEFGEIAIDGSLLEDSSVQISELSSGCICCSISGDFKTALTQLIEQNHFDRIIIEPSGVAKLSEVIDACKSVARSGLATFGQALAVVDAEQFELFLENFGEFYKDQIQSAHQILLSKVESVSAENLISLQALIRQLNARAQILALPWHELGDNELIAFMDLDFELFEAGDFFQILKPVHDHEHRSNTFETFGLTHLGPMGKHELIASITQLKESELGKTIIRGKGLFLLTDGTGLKLDWVGSELQFAPWQAPKDSRFCLIGRELDKASLNQYFVESVSPTPTSH